MIYKFLFILLFFSLHLGLASQNKQSLIKNVTDSLMVAKTGSVNNNCIENWEKGRYDSCFEINGKLEWITDFNGDGEDDLLIYIFDEGAGSGGNGFRYEYVVVLMKNGKIEKTYPLFGGEKFSTGLLNIDKVEHGKIFATYRENPKGNYEELPPPYKSVNLIFEYTRGMIVEKSYYKCPIAELDKRIFKANSSYPVQRTTQLNELFEIEQREKIFLQLDNSYIYATLSGCDNTQIRFSLEIPYTEDLETDNVFLGRTMLDYIRILQENTRYSSILTLLMKRVQNAYFYSTPDELFSATYELPNKWEAWVRALKITTEKGEFARLILHLDKKENPEKTFFWDQINR